jgi:photosystem II stability/assembly factor-like uncharacterized protein
MRRVYPLLALLGCSAAPRTATVVGPTVAAPAPPAVVRVRGRAEWRLSARPVDVVAPRGATPFLYGNLRALVEDGRVTLSDDRSAQPIADAVDLGGRWVFVDYGGGVMASDTFVGALQPLGRVPLGARTNPRSRGRAAFVAAGRLWLCDGRALSEAQVPGALVLDAAFARAAVGVVVHRDGAASLTEDGGVTWRAVDLHGELALAAAFEGDALRLTTTGGERVQSGSAFDPAPAASPAAPTEDAARSEGLRRAVTEAVWARDGMRGRRVVTTASGTRVTLDEGLLARTEAGAEAILGRIGTNTCDALEPWGDGFGVQCDRLLRGEASGRIVRVELPPNARDDEATILSDDGLHAARNGACPTPPNAERDEELPATRPSAACVLDDGIGRWRTVSLPAPGEWQRWEIAGMHGARLLLRVGDGDAMQWQVYDATAERGSDVASEPPTQLRELAWLRDGSLVGVGATCAGADCTLSLVRGASDAPLHPSTLPEGARHVAFADASRGMALGETLGAVWRTTDGGASWEPVPIPERLRSEPVSPSATVACDAGGCQVGTSLRIDGWGSLRAEDERVVAVDGEPPDATEVTPRPASFALDRVRCTAVGSVAPSPWRLPGGALRSVGPTVAWTFERADAHRTRVRWSGERGRGEAVVPFDLPEREAPLGLWGETNRALVAAPDAMRLFVATGATVRALPETILPVTPGAFWAASADVVPEGAGLTLQTTGEVARTRVDLDLSLDATGAPTRHLALRGRTLTEAPALALARRGGRWTRALVTASGVQVTSPDGATALLPGWTGVLHPCARPTTPNAVILRVAGCAGQGHCLGSELAGNVLKEVAEVELTDGGACLRSIGLWALSRTGVDLGRGREGEWRPVGVNLRASAGALAGFADDGVRRATVRCVAE